MADFRLEAETRTEFGKGSARRTRRAGRVPAVLYGHGQDVVHLSLPAREFAAALRNGGSNALLTIVLNGKEQLALTKAVQRDPIKRVHEHVDLVIVRRGEKVTVDVPVVVVGETAPDTLVSIELNTVSLTASAVGAELAEAEAEAGIEREEHAEAAEGAGEGDVVPEPQDQGSGESMDSAEKSADA